MMRVGGHAHAANFGVDFRAAGLGMFQFFQNQNQE